MSAAGLLPGALPANVVVALLAALSWGAGDFAGGMGVKVSGGGTSASLRVIASAHAISLSGLCAVYFLSGGSIPRGLPTFWALLAGVIAGLSITVFYVSLSEGAMGAAAAVSGLLAAAIPAGASALLEGRPTALQAAGFLVAGVAIWLIASTPAEQNQLNEHSKSTEAIRRGRKIMLFALLGGLGFGVYFLLLKLANPLGFVAPVALARMGSLVTCLILLRLLVRANQVRPPGAPGESGTFGLVRAAWPWIFGVALLDTGGNLLYLASTRLGRLDIAAVLAALYPAGTIVLAATYLHERPTPRQFGGMGLAAIAVVMVTV